MNKRLAAALVAAVLVPVALTSSHPATAAPTGFSPPAIKHVWIIELENKSFDAAFVQNTNTYLWKTLPSQGKLLRQYYGTGHFSLDNYLSEMSGQAPNVVTQADCQSYVDVVGGITSPAGGGQVIGSGCVYPAAVKTLPNQLQAKGLSWRGYMQDLGLDPTREDATCGQPKSGGTTINPSTPGANQDGTQSATPTDQYAARHNPFVYFHSIIDDKASCSAHVVPFAGHLAQDLKEVSTTPNFSFITPNLCDDAHDATCAGKNDAGNNQGGLLAADLFLKKTVPMIQASPAYQQDGLIIVTIDESGDLGTPSGATACCGEPSGPNTPQPGQVGPGGGRIGTVLLSKRFIKPGTVDDVAYNHYSMLRSLEDLFRIGATPAIPGSDGAGHLGYAGMTGLAPFGDDVYDGVDQAVAVPALTTLPTASKLGRLPTTSSVPPQGLPSTGLPWQLPVAALGALGASELLRRRRRVLGATARG